MSGLGYVEGLRRFEFSDRQKQIKGRLDVIYELRTYEAMPGKMQALNQRFANITVQYFEKHGLNTVGFWTERVGTSNTIVYMLAFDDMGHMERAWNAFRADSQRLRLFAETEREGPLVFRITNRILTPTDYSPLQ